MLRSMFSGVSGLRSHQQMVDVTGNNIANVNTTGFRSSRVQFADVLSQTSRAGSAGAGGEGGVNPSQIGLGVRVGSVDATTTPGSLTVTGRAGDMALQGDGFFVTRAGNQQMFTRAGAFSFDNAGRLVASNGSIVQGWSADELGAVDLNSPLTDIVAGAGMQSPPRATTSVTMSGNLSAQAAVGDTFKTSVDIYDSLGASHRIEVTMTKTGTNTWDQTAQDPAGAPLAPATVTLTFDPATGQLAAAAPAPNYTYAPVGADPVNFTTDFGAPGAAGALTQFGGEATMRATGQDGYENGFLRTVGIADGGVVIGTFSNGVTRTIAQVAVATVTNPAGMEKAGDNMYALGQAAGALAIGAANTAGRGDIAAGALESSNVDLAQEFTNLIVAQRGFQANSRVITTSDEILNELTQLKR